MISHIQPLHKADSSLNFSGYFWNTR